MKRLRPAHTPQRLATLYRTPHDHTRWPDHEVRVQATIAVGLELLNGPVESGADLSAGSGAILRGLEVQHRIFGDFAPGYEYAGPIEQSIEQIPDVDVFVCCETLEHLDDPPVVLKQIRGKTRMLLLSTPVDAWEDRNPEHYWAWSKSDVDEMLSAAEFEVVEYADLDFRGLGPDWYCFGIWGCR